MYLTESRLFDVVKKQVYYKFNAYTGVFSSLLILQIIGILFSFNAMGTSGFETSDSLSVTNERFTNDTAVVFTLIWAFTTGIIVTTKAYRHDIFSLVTNRLSHHLSNVVFLLIASCIAGITMVLSRSIVHLSSLFNNETIIIASNSILQHPTDFLKMMATAILYTILTISIAYVIGSFAQRSMLLVSLVVIVLFVSPMLQLDLNLETFIGRIAAFFGEEKSLFLFFIKIIGTAALLFTISIGVTNKLEVKK